MKHLTFSLFIFCSILIIQTGIISIFTESLPNQFEFTLINNLEYFFELFNSNPSSAISVLLIHKPIFIIHSIDKLTDNQTWGFYLMPISTIMLLVLAMLITWIKQLSPAPKIWTWLILASVILSVSVFYLRVQTCCTANPSWLLEVILLSLIYNPILNSAFWQDIYLLITPWFTVIQLLMISSALMIFYTCIVSCQKTNQKNI